MTIPFHNELVFIVHDREYKESDFGDEETLRNYGVSQYIEIQYQFEQKAFSENACYISPIKVADLVSGPQEIVNVYKNTKFKKFKAGDAPSEISLFLKLADYMEIPDGWSNPYELPPVKNDI